LDQVRAGVEGGRDFGGIESSEAAAGSSADVNEASAVAEAVGDNIDGAGDLWKGASHDLGYGGVLLIDQADHFQRGHLIQITGGGEDLFGGKFAKILFRGASSVQCLPFVLSFLKHHSLPQRGVEESDERAWKYFNHDERYGPNETTEVVRTAFCSVIQDWW
jgi:hypothetical protein